MKPITLEEFASLLTGVDGGLDDESLCYCGTKQDAVDAAIKFMGQMVENDCPIWALQVANSMFLVGRAVAERLAGDPGLSDQILAEMFNVLQKERNLETLKELREKIEL